MSCEPESDVSVRSAKGRAFMRARRHDPSLGVGARGSEHQEHDNGFGCIAKAR